MSLHIPNEMILASAGSGKTWQLTNRYIALMGQQLLAGHPVTPERIVAVTFTRKAAGEFFDEILKKLADAAADPTRAAALHSNPNDPLRPVLSQLGTVEYRRLLRVFVDRMPRLFLGTLDSFFSNILRSFPAEFGLAGDFEIIDDHLAAVAREQVYRIVFQRALGSGANAAQEEFLEAFRLATFGREENSVRWVLDNFVDNQHEIYLHAASGEKWGNRKAIWPRGTNWLGVKVDLDLEFDRLFEIFSAESVSEKQFEFWQQFREELTAHTPGLPIPYRTGFFLTKLLPNWDQIEGGKFALTVNRQNQELSGESCDVLWRIVTHFVGGELDTRLKRTHGIWEILSLYEQTYSRLVRRKGRLTFQDMELILAGHEFGTDHPRPMLSQMPGPEERLRIDYRLDAQYDHWLLDEFQDTNYVQWNVIANLIDEAVQDTSEERSLFQVGDVKQAIYAWRGGDTRLFHDIYDHYKGEGDEPRIRPRALNVSWRSGHDVIDLVNRVFEPEPAFAQLAIPKSAIDRWKWEKHEVAPPNEQLPGYACWLNPRTDKPEDEDRYEIVVQLLEEIQPVDRGLSCAILVQENRKGRALVEYIRARSPSRIPVMSESDISIATDNPLTLALLSLLKFAAHPGDRFAWEHLRMTPFARVFEEHDMGPGKVVSRVLRQVYDHGFEHAIRHWLTELEVAGLEIRPFTRRRAEEMALAARLFDQSGSRDTDEFLAYADRYTTREPDTRSAVQVMTIHKSKGLTFDVVILPDLEGGKLTTIRKSIGVKRNAQRQVDWVYDLPSSVIVEADPVLKDYRDDRQADAAYEELCKFYVALTRAKHANYLVTNPRKKTSASNNFVKLLELTLGGEPPVSKAIGSLEADCLFETEKDTTRTNWYEPESTETESPPTESPEHPEEEAPLPLPTSARLRPRRRTPSGSETQAITARQLFGREGRRAREYGTLVHEFFEQIEWLDAIGGGRVEDLWSGLRASDPGIRQLAEREVLDCLKSKDVRQALCRPSPEAECWRERRFEILLDGDWLSGTFDRVVVEPDRAIILDFKTDRLEDGDEAGVASRIDGYRPQLDLYRQVLMRMTGLPEEKIEARLLFTKLKRVVSLGDS